MLPDLTPLARLAMVGYYAICVVVIGAIALAVGGVVALLCWLI